MHSPIIYKHLFDMAPLGMVIISMEGKILETNIAFGELLGYEADKLKDKEYKSLIVKEKFYKKSYNSEGLNSKTNNKEKNNKDFGIVSFKKKNGNIIEVSYKYTDINLEDNVKLRIIQIVEIINDLQVKQVLEQESGLFDALINSFPNEIFIKNKESQFIMVNKANLEKLNQSSLDSIIGKTDFDFFDVAHAQKAYNDEQKIIKSGRPILNFEEKESYPDGRIAYISSSKMPLINRNGEIIGVFGVSQDITERKIHELQLREQTSILHAITSKMPIVIFKYNRIKGLISLIGTNEIKKAFESSKMARLKIADSLNHFVDKIDSQKSKSDFLNFSSTSNINKKEWFFENFIFKGHADSQEYIGLAFDNTDKKLIEQKLKRDARDLEKANKELNQFAYIISHDLKAPLRAITNLSEWIEEDLVDYDNPEVKEQLNLLRGRVGRMENLINGILTYSRLTRAKIICEKVEVGKLIDEIEDNLMLDTSFKIIKSNFLPNIKSSKIHLEQIFTNLISNSIKHHNKENGNIHISYREVSGMHQFMVADDGPGIAPEYHQKIFQIFQTLKARDAFESTGIGLTIVKKLTEGLGGEVTIDSNEGNGCKIYFSLPKIR